MACVMLVARDWLLDTVKVSKELEDLLGWSFGLKQRKRSDDPSLHLFDITCEDFVVTPKLRKIAGHLIKLRLNELVAVDFIAHFAGSCEGWRARAARAISNGITGPR
jgi:hypothetical protein